MVRIKHSVSTHKRKKRVLKNAKGQFGQRSRRYQQAKRSLMKSMTYSYRDRRVKKREIKNIWVIRINAACRESGVSYSRFIRGLSLADIQINRKMLAELAVRSPKIFDQLVLIAKELASASSSSSPSRKLKASKN